MKYIGQMTGLFLMTILFIVVNFIGDVLSVGLLYTVFILLVGFGWWIGKQFDKMLSEFSSLQKNKEEVEEQNKSLQQSKEELQQFYDSLDMTIFSYNRLTNHFYASKGIEHILGYSSKDFYDHPKLWKKIIYPDDVAISDENEKQLYSGVNIEMKHRIITKNDDIRWVLIKATPIQNSAGKVIKINGTLLDITVEKQLEEKLKRLAYFDNLTDLPNRTNLDRHMRKVLARSRRHDHNVIIAFIDLDGFKQVC